MAHNKLLELLPRKDRVHLLAASDPINLENGQVLGQLGAPLRYVYFPSSGAVSLLASVDGHQGLEVGVIGAEGMVGAHVFLGTATAPVQTEVSHPGAAWRVELQTFMRQMASLRSLRLCLSAYLSVFISQLTTTAGCFCFHEIGPRMARRILIAHDHAQTNRFALTQDSLALLLGVRRSSVSIAASALRLSGLIDYRRGELTVLKRKNLEATACSCYGAFGRAYREGIRTKNLGV